MKKRSNSSEVVTIIFVILGVICLYLGLHIFLKGIYSAPEIFFSLAFLFILVALGCYVEKIFFYRVGLGLSFFGLAILCLILISYFLQTNISISFILIAVIIFTNILLLIYLYPTVKKLVFKLKR